MNTYDLFIAVVELDSFSAAAKKLNRSPSAVSKQIRFLEDRLGVQLFSRTTRSLSLTSAGRLYYERCIDISRKMEMAEAELKDFSNEPAGQISITWPNVLSSSDVVQTIGGFCEKYPNIKLNVKVDSDMFDFHKDKIDFAIRVALLEDSSLIAIKLYDIQTVFCASPQLIARYGQPNTMQELLGLPQVIPTYLPLARVLKHFFPEVKGFDESIHHQVSDIMALYNMVKSGFGVGFIAKHVVAKELEEGSLIDLSIGQHPQLPVYLIFPKMDHTLKKNRYFIDYLKDHYVV